MHPIIVAIVLYTSHVLIGTNIMGQKEYSVESWRLRKTPFQHEIGNSQRRYEKAVSHTFGVHLLWTSPIPLWSWKIWWLSPSDNLYSFILYVSFGININRVNFNILKEPYSLLSKQTTSMWPLVIIANVSLMRPSFCSLTEWIMVLAFRNLILVKTGGSVW